VLAVRLSVGQSGAMAEIEWDTSSRRIVVTGSPDEWDSLEALVDAIRDGVMERRIMGITDMNNESTDEAAVVAMLLTRDANAQTVLDEVCKLLPTAEDGE
jgi:DNA gyrase/topoisomerase IV subunit A